jgi:hypothetical protein
MATMICVDLTSAGLNWYAKGSNGQQSPGASTGTYVDFCTLDCSNLTLPVQVWTDGKNPVLVPNFSDSNGFKSLVVLSGQGLQSVNQK